MCYQVIEASYRARPRKCNHDFWTAQKPGFGPTDARINLLVNCPWQICEMQLFQLKLIFLHIIPLRF